MKKQILTLSLITFCLATTIISCKKDAKPDDTDNTIKDELAVHSDDQSRFASEIDAVAADANLALETNPGMAGRFEDVQGIICDGTIVADLVSNPMTLTVTYDGTNCLGNRTRTGKVIISMAQGTKWKTAGAAVTVTYQNVKITRVRDSKSVTLNGAQTYTNVSGGLLINLPTLNTITHKITSDGLNVKFDNAAERNWKVAKQLVYTYSNGVVVTNTGLHTEANQSGIAEWGTNRFGQAFNTAILEPIILKQDCNFRITSGKLQHTNPAATATATFGLDATGNPTGCPGANSYYYKLVWTGRGGNSFSVILPY